MKSPTLMPDIKEGESIYKNYKPPAGLKATVRGVWRRTDPISAGSCTDPPILAPELISSDDGSERNGGDRFNMKRRKKRILIVEDDHQARLGLQQLMCSIGYDAEGAGDWLEAVRLIEEKLFDLAIVDAFLSPRERQSIDGLDLIRLLRVFNPNVPVILVTGQGDEQLQATALKHGATLYLEKPLNPRFLTRVVQQLLGKAADERAAAFDR